MELNNEQVDALKEIGNIGAGNAATALGQLLEKKISINVPNVRLLSFDKFPKLQFLENPGEFSIAVSHRILGELKGGLLILFPQKSALSMIDILSHRKIGSTEIFSMLDESALSESSNIICCSYLNAIGQFLHLYQLIPSIADTSISTIDKLTSVLTKRFVSPDVHHVLPIENRLRIEDVELSLFVIFMLESESLSKVLSMLGMG